jgi:hypothetical protein
MDDFEGTGFIVVKGAIDATELAALRAECELLAQDHEVRGRDLLESGCVLDLFRDVPIPDNSPCRSNAAMYARERRKTLEVGGFVLDLPLALPLRWLLPGLQRNGCSFVPHTNGLNSAVPALDALAPPATL